MESQTTTVDLLVEPNEQYLQLVKPTTEILQRVLATIKNCQKEKVECNEYVELSHSILDTLINQPLEI